MQTRARAPAPRRAPGTKPPLCMGRRLSVNVHQDLRQLSACSSLSWGAPHVHWLCADPRKFALSWKVKEEEEREQQEADAV